MVPESLKWFQGLLAGLEWFEIVENRMIKHGIECLKMVRDGTKWYGILLVWNSSKWLELVESGMEWLQMT